LIVAPELGLGEASARAALAGNPSDGYGGAVLAMTLPSHGARACARPASGVGASPESRLVHAAAARFIRELAPGAGGAAIEWSTSVPRGVGMGGSSAIVIATLRALTELHGVEIGRSELAELALAVETEDLGIAAGLQDRVAQSYGGLTFMDFAAGRYESLDQALLPPIVVAWREDAGGESGAVHSGLRARFERGEGAVTDCMAELSGLARRARDAVLAGNTPELIRCVDRSVDARERMMELDPRHVEMVRCARASGAGANYAGSGGAIVAVCPDERVRERVASELGRLGCAMTLV
jgi:galactokinase/mevalonate kinase-like predicted kinase